MGKRGHGEGSIHQREVNGKPRWVAILHLGYDENGKRQRKYLYGDTRKEAARKLADAQRTLDAGLTVQRNERQTLQQYMESWLRIAEPTVRPDTWLRYEQITRLHIVPTLGRTSVSKLTAQQVQELYSQKLAEGLSPRTVRYIHATLRRALGEAAVLGIVARNVATMTKPPRLGHHEMHVLNERQARTLLEAAHGDRLEALWVLSVRTGLRRGELLGLRWHSIDLDQGALQVVAQLKWQRGGKWSLADVKTKHGRRRIMLSPPVVDALRAHRRRQLEERLELGEAWEDNDLIFCYPTRQPMPPSHVLRYEFYPLLKRAGLPQIRLHDLRHTCATILLGRGVNPKIVSELLGHATISITLNVYSHVLPDMQQQAAAAMDAALGGLEEGTFEPVAVRGPKRG